MDTLGKYSCPACAFDLDFLPWDGLFPSDEICPCCGIQFGYDDAAGGDLYKRRNIYESWKNRWIREGMQWKSIGIPPPINWDPAKQLMSLEKKRN